MTNIYLIFNNIPESSIKTSVMFKESILTKAKTLPESRIKPDATVYLIKRVCILSKVNNPFLFLLTKIKLKIILPELDILNIEVFYISTYLIPLILKIISIVLLMKKFSLITHIFPGEITENNPIFYS